MQKSKLKADCEKEIEVVVAQIRMKYETKIRETEAECLLKSNELQANQNKVLMNKILAEAFRSKCVDLRASAGQAVQQGKREFPLLSPPCSHLSCSNSFLFDFLIYLFHILFNLVSL